MDFLPPEHEEGKKFYLQKQEATSARPGQPGRPCLCLTNPENTNELVLAEQNFSPSQTWHWFNDILVCGTGQVLHDLGESPRKQSLLGNAIIAGKPGQDLYGNPVEIQKFYPFKIISPMIPDKEFCFIGKLSEKGSMGEKVFLYVSESGSTCMETVDDYLLNAKNMQNTIDMCWQFVYRQIEAKEEDTKEQKNKEIKSTADTGEEEKKEEATFGDFMGVMGGLMAAFAPPKQGDEIQKQFQQMGQAMGPMLEGLAKVAGSLDTVAYKWSKMDNDLLPENAIAVGKDQSDICNVFVGCTVVFGEPCVGKVHNGNRYFGMHGREHIVSTEEFSVLCVDPDATMEWIEYTDEKIPNDAVIGGTLSTGENLYVARGYVNNQLTPGLVYTDSSPYELHALYNGRVNTLAKFDVLVVKPTDASPSVEVMENVHKKGAEMKTENLKTVQSVFDEIESIEAEIEAAEEKHDNTVAEIKREHKKEMIKMKKKLNNKKKDLKNAVNLI